MESLPSKKSFSHYFQITDDDDDGLTKWLKSISFLSALIALLVFIDYFLPLQEENHRIKALAVRSGFSEVDYAVYQKLRKDTGEEEFWLILNDEELAISEENMGKLRSNGEITLYKTPIFGINVKAKSEFIQGDIVPFFNVYGFLLIIPCIFLLFFILMRVFGKKTEVVLSIGVVNIFLLVGFGVLLLFY